MSLIRSSLLAALTALVIAGGRFLLVVIVAKRMDTASFGEFVFAQWLVEITLMATSLGLHGVASRYLAEYGSNPAKSGILLLRWFPWAAGLPVVSGMVVVAAAKLAGLALTDTGYALLATWTITTGWWNMQTAALIGQRRFGVILCANVIWSSIVLAAGVLMPSFSESLEALFITMVVSSFSALVLGLRSNLAQLVKRPGASDIAIPWPDVRIYAINVWLTGLLWTLVWSRGELPLVRLYMGDHGVARYTVALTLYFGAVQAIMLWVGGIAPHLAALWGLERKGEALAIARRLSDAQILVSASGAIVLACFGRELLSLIFDTSNDASTYSLAILLMGLVTFSASAQNYLLQLVSSSRFNRDTSLVGLCVLYAAAAILVPMIGIEGAAISRIVAMWALFSISLIAVRRRWGGEAMSVANSLMAAATVCVPILALAFGELRLMERLIVSAGSICILMLGLRTQDNKLVASDLFCVLWPKIEHLFSRVRNTK